jgi:hypothetical protein
MGGVEANIAIYKKLRDLVQDRLAPPQPKQCPGWLVATLFADILISIYNDI